MLSRTATLGSALLVAAVVLALSGCGRAPKSESEEHKAVWQAALSRAEYVCGQQRDLSAAAARQCVQTNAAAFLREWERAHPDQ